MKQLTLILFLTILSGFTSIIDAEDKPTTGPTTIELKKRPQCRPHDASSPGEVSCVYLNGYITTEFENPEGRATITVTCLDDGTSASSTFYTITPYSMYVGDVPGVYEITVKTSQNTYTGTLIL